MLQNIFQTFFVTAERPKLGFLVTLIAGCSNIVGDWLLVGVFRFEVEGAAVATVLGEALGAIIPIVYFFKKNNGSILRLGKTEMHGKVLLDACTNGSSEFLSNVSGSFVSMLYNYQLTRLVGSDGVGAYGVLMYVNFIFFAIFIGYAVGIAPVVGYNYGAKNDSELKNIFKKSMILMGIFGVAMTVFAETFAPVLADVFSAGNQHMYELTCRAFLFSGFVFLMCGFNIFGSAFFTALGNRSYFRAYFVFKNARFPDRLRAFTAAFSRYRRNLAGGRRVGFLYADCHLGLPFCKAQKILLHVTARRT